ncbi:hypothetical protein U5801_13655 [Lamprobacter modestohalophilus]|uniref:hypothetical protein n=1 Tax=Lamprobacter modestohalophilus TaxID=1064514 RepID=UPI002ADEBD14|nr:hypothetical protein [Lamprobacter modestohalophilus]MEA1050845.1 hypothetical protein [Lamprobacter modestohalophilus]
MSAAKTQLTPQALRELVRDAIPAESTEYGAPPPAHQFFMPKSHARALHLNLPVVVGSRGTGKSFWWAALQSKEHRRLVEQSAPDARIKEATQVRPGFGVTSDPKHYPSRDTLAMLLERGRSAREIWRTVVVWAAAEGELVPELKLWEQRVAWVVEHPEQVEGLLHAKDLALQAQDADLLVLFDGLDWTSNDWGRVFILVEGLLQVALEVRSYRRIRAKVFLRSDQFDDQRIARFPDASKLVASRVQLTWHTNELYGLLWKLLAFHPAKGGDFRLFVFDRIVNLTGSEKALKDPGTWQLPSEVYFDAKVQQRLFHELTGPYMGDNARCGFPYKWLTTHLADAHGETTPRSFLVALRSAAEETIERHPESGFALAYRGLQVGVRVASRIRVDEISEHWWVPEVLRPLPAALRVPFCIDALEARWHEDGTLDRIAAEWQQRMDSGGVVGDVDRPWLLPAHLDDGMTGVCRDLEALGVFRRMRQERIDVPDIYRLGFELRRKGGIPPKSVRQGGR